MCHVLTEKLPFVSFYRLQCSRSVASSPYHIVGRVDIQCVFTVARFVCDDLSQRSGCRQCLDNLPLVTSVLIQVQLLMYFFFSLAITCPPFLYSYFVPHSFISYISFSISFAFN